MTIEFVQAYAHWFSYLAAAPTPENTLLTQYIAQARAGTQTGLAAEFNRCMLNPGSVHG
ncbi:MAG: hypothetical protein HC938_14825, partial [Nitrospira sp.]|nr:hypothetical protein [Nitrospira sp.]